MTLEQRYALVELTVVQAGSVIAKLVLWRCARAGAGQWIQRIRTIESAATVADGKFVELARWICTGVQTEVWRCGWIR